MLRLDSVSKVYKVGTFGGTSLQAVRGVSFDIRPGEIVSLIGESGSGKSTIGRMILRLDRVSSGVITFDDADIAQFGRSATKAYYREVQGVFQDPFSSYNPVFKADRVFTMIRDAYFAGVPRDEWRDKLHASLASVGLSPDEVMNRYPHQLSGGQLQRLLIARALLLDIRILVADEIISMLDASTRIDVLNLLADLKARGLGILFITHDLSLGNYVSDRTLILHRGAVVEMGATEKVFGDPRHAYTRMLLASVPQLHQKWRDSKRNGDLALPALGGARRRRAAARRGRRRPSRRAPRRRRRCDMSADPLGIGLIGCGKISETYVRSLAGSDEVRILRCADLDPDRARLVAAAAGAEATTTGELLEDDVVDIVLNLTPPAHHADVALAALDAGKHVYGEKPLAVDREQGRRVLDAAAARELAVGCAPDTFLGRSWQRARGLLDAGAVGEPVAVRATMLGAGPESWHPDPAFFYRRGGGPLLDMGPYYLTALVSLLGPVRRVSASARTTFRVRPVTGGPRVGELLDVEVPDARRGAARARVRRGRHARHELRLLGRRQLDRALGHGRHAAPARPERLRGHRSAPRARAERQLGDDGRRGGDLPPRHRRRRDGAGRSASASRPRASGELAFHVLDTLLAVLESADAGVVTEIGSRCERPAPLTDPVAVG